MCSTLHNHDVPKIPHPVRISWFAFCTGGDASLDKLAIFRITIRPLAYRSVPLTNKKTMCKITIARIDNFKFTYNLNFFWRQNGTHQPPAHLINPSSHIASKRPICY
jgi:hypothetical protein